MVCVPPPFSCCCCCPPNDDTVVVVVVVVVVSFGPTSLLMDTLPFPFSLQLVCPIRVDVNIRACV